MKYDIITIGGAVEDITFYTDEGIIIDNKKDILRQKLFAFEYGAKIKIKSAHSTFGGGAANVAIAAKRLGFESACFCAVGKDERGSEIIENLKKHKVDTRFVQKINEQMSGFSFLLVGPGNEHVIFSNRAANQKLSVSKESLKEVDCEYAYMTSLSGNWKKTAQAVISQYKRFKIAWNPGAAQLREAAGFFRKYLRYIEVFDLNEDEAVELVALDKKVMADYKESAVFLSNIKNLLKVIKSYGPRVVIITRGRKGADCYDGREFYHIDIKNETKRVDTTGVGDAFGSAFVCGLMLYKGDIKKAMELGIKNSASVIAKQGAQNGLIKL